MRKHNFCLGNFTYISLHLLVLIPLIYGCDTGTSTIDNATPGDSVTKSPAAVHGAVAAPPPPAGTINKKLHILSLTESDFRTLLSRRQGNAQIAFQFFVNADSDTLTLKAWAGKQNDDSLVNPIILRAHGRSSVDYNSTPFDLAIQKLTHTMIRRIGLSTTAQDDELLIFYPYVFNGKLMYEVQVINVGFISSMATDAPTGTATKVADISTNPAPPGIFNNRANDLP